jgi:site-specific DNA recombinase
MLRVAFYARVSGGSQKEEQTIESQLAALKEFAATEGFQLDAEHFYIDNGYSGFYFDRPDLDRLRDAARDGLIDVVLVHDPDRLARRYAYQVLLIEELQRWGVQVRFIEQPPADSPDQKLLVQIQGAIAEYERARILERTRRGRLFWARQGRPVSSVVPFGYRYIPRGRTEAPRVEVDESESEVVVMIFRWYVDEGLNMRQTALRLTSEGVATPTGRSAYWDPSTVGFILQDEAYLGTWYLNKHRVETDPGGLRKRVVKRPREQWIPIPVTALIDAELFNKAQQIREQGPRGSYPLKYPDTHLLRRLVVCKACGRKMTCLNSKSKGHVHPYYWCRGKDPHRLTGKHCQCPHPTARTDRVDELVWADVVAMLTDPQLVLEAWCEQYGHDDAQYTEVIDEESRRLKRQLSDVKKQRERILIAYEQGAIELDEMMCRRDKLDSKARSVQEQLNRLKKQAEQKMALADLDKNITEVCQALGSKLTTLSKRQKMELCGKLIEKVDVDDHDLDIHYRFPVSSSCNRRREGAGVFLQAPAFLSIMPPACLALF